jgi:hypothetical protein
MRRSRTALFFLAIAALTAACSRSTVPPPRPAPPAARASAPDVAISESDLPRPKHGLWQMTEFVGGIADHPVNHCYRGGLLVMPPSRPFRCSALSFKRTAAGEYVMDATCVITDMTETMHDVVRGDFAGGHYTDDDRVHVQTAGGGTEDFTGHAEAHWLGPC